MTERDKAGSGEEASKGRTEQTNGQLQVTGQPGDLSDKARRLESLKKGSRDEVGRWEYEHPLPDDQIEVAAEFLRFMLAEARGVDVDVIEPYDLQSYKQTIWRPTIEQAFYEVASMKLESIYFPDKEPFNPHLAEWTDWMLRGGCQLSEREVYSKLEELKPLF